MSCAARRHELRSCGRSCCRRLRPTSSPAWLAPSSSAIEHPDRGSQSMSRIVDLTLPVVTGMAGIPKIPFYEQYPVKVQAVTVVNEEQRASLAREGVDVMDDAPAIASMNTVFT